MKPISSLQDRLTKVSNQLQSINSLALTRILSRVHSKVLSCSSRILEILGAWIWYQAKLRPRAIKTDWQSVIMWGITQTHRGTLIYYRCAALLFKMTNRMCLYPWLNQMRLITIAAETTSKCPIVLDNQYCMILDSLRTHLVLSGNTKIWRPSLMNLHSLLKIMIRF